MKRSTKNYIKNHVMQPDKEWNKKLSECYEKYLGVDSDCAFINLNFNEVLSFIGSHCYLADRTIVHKEESWTDDENKRFANAYKVIRHEIKYYILNGISKKELQSIRKSYVRILDKSDYIKIPYKVQYIFATVYDILNELSANNILLPNSINIYKGHIYRTIFYESPFNKYKSELIIKKNISKHSKIRYDLDMQLESKFNEVPFISKI